METAAEPPASDEWIVTARDEAETDRFAAALAAALEPGLVVTLIGNLGAGKTRLVRGVAAALDVNPRAVSSPTFVLINEYDGRLPVYHVDAYRLSGADEFLELGAEEMMAGAGVCLIEWADRVAAALPSDLLRIEIEPIGPTARRFKLIASGPRSRRIVAAIRSGVR